jgi:LysM repeat protein
MNRKHIVLLAVLALAFLALSALPAAAQNVPFVTYVVTPEDANGGLSKIATRFCTTWVEIYNINRNVIGPNPNVIEPGMVLTVPNRCPAGTGVFDRGPSLNANGTVSGNVYTVAAGDHLSRIAQRFGVPMNTIIAANNIQNPNKLLPGQRILIPGLTGGSITPPPVNPTPTPIPPSSNYRSLAPNECVILPMAGRPMYSYPNQTVLGFTTTPATVSASVVARANDGAIWYLFPTTIGSSRTSVWMKQADLTSTRGNCGL